MAHREHCIPIFLSTIFIATLTFCQPVRAQSPISASVLEPEAETLYVSVFADGNVRSIATGSAEQEATGSLGIAIVRGDESQWAAHISVASSVDTLESNFANFLLVPGVSGGAFQSAVLDVRLNDVLDPILGQRFRGYGWGLHMYASASRSVWQVEGNDIDVSVVSSGLMAFTDIVKRNFGDNAVLLSVELGPSLRYLGGNTATNRDLLFNALGSRGRFNFGLEGGMQIKFNHVTASMQFYRLWDIEEGEDIPGLTGFQVVAGVGVQVNIFSQKTSLERKP